MVEHSEYPVERGAEVGITVRRPPSLERLHQNGVELVLAARQSESPPADSSSFRPNLVIMTTPSNEPIETMSSAAMATAIAENPNAHLIACDLVQSEAFGDGRRIEFVYWIGEAAVCVTQWIFADAGREICVTASRSTDQVLGTDSTFEWVVGTMRRPEAN